jgi:3-methyladenine DNA glycosylase AlkD
LDSPPDHGDKTPEPINQLAARLRQKVPTAIMCKLKFTSFSHHIAIYCTYAKGIQHHRDWWTSAPYIEQIDFPGLSMTSSTTVIHKQLQRFFKTGPGQYGEGDVFLGIKVPPLRALAKRYANVGLDTIATLLGSRYHEERFFALLLLMQFYGQATDKDKVAAYNLYLAHTHRINNWDLVDVSAPHIVGRHLHDRPRKVLHKLARSSSLWERRIAILATFWFIRLNDLGDSLRIAAALLHDEHDLMHKAVGWMLREVGKRNLAAEEDFLKEHYRSMPRTMLRYAIEHFPERKRKKYLNGKM